MTWIPIAAGAGALVFGIVVLAFCAYEITWKARRLSSDLARLQATQADAMTLRDALQSAAERLQRATGTGTS
jgi:hypothetical protein